MRVIAGEFRSRRLKSMPGLAVRPTPDRLREALFNVLAPRIEGAVFLDVYAGVGSVGIEALSRGAARAIFVERRRGPLGVIRENLRSLGIEERAELILGTATSYLPRAHADIVFLDPPYDLQDEYGVALEILGRIAPPLAIVQHAGRHRLPEVAGVLQCYRLLNQGDNALSFFQPVGFK